MRHYFIDLENVRSAGLEGVLSLTEDDRVFVFYSDNANTLTIPTLESINGSKAGVRYIKTNYTGSNAMDFQIVAMYGAMIEKEKKGSFYIISHDNGFKSAVSFCTSYFSEYDIRLGAYSTIKAASDSEAQRPDRRTNVMPKQNQENAAVKTPPGKGVVAGNDVTEQSEEKSTGKKNRKRASAGKKKKNSAASTKTETENSSEKKLKYLYDALAKLLSEATIDVYASAIHEALINSQNRNDLRAFFEKRYGADEAEALYSIIQADFTRLKAMARKSN